MSSGESKSHKSNLPVPTSSDLWRKSNNATETLAILLSEKDHLYWYEKAWDNFTGDDYERVKYYLERALQVKPDFWKAHYELVTTS
jgi:hypothetical protein